MLGGKCASKEKRFCGVFAMVIYRKSSKFLQYSGFNKFALPVIFLQVSVMDVKCVQAISGHISSVSGRLKRSLCTADKSSRYDEKAIHSSYSAFKIPLFFTLAVLFEINPPTLIGTVKSKFI